MLFGYFIYEFKLLLIICLFLVVFVLFFLLVFFKCEIKVSLILGLMVLYNIVVVEILVFFVFKGIVFFFFFVNIVIKYK